jgi:hypothetical protein
MTTAIKQQLDMRALSNISQHEDMQSSHTVIRDAMARRDAARNARTMAETQRAQADAALVENSGKKFVDAADEAELKWSRARREERAAEDALDAARRNFDEAYAQLARTLNDEVCHPQHLQLVGQFLASLQPAMDAHNELVRFEEHYERVMPRGLGLRRLPESPLRQVFGKGGLMESLRRHLTPPDPKRTTPDTRVWVEFVRDADVTGHGGYTTGDRAPFPPATAELLTTALPPDPSRYFPGRKAFAKRVEGPST